MPSEAKPCTSSRPCLSSNCEDCAPFRFFQGLMVAMAISVGFYVGIWWMVWG